MSARTHGYTVVQHSAYGYKADIRFKQGLQPITLNNARERANVISRGGVVFDTYKEADDFCDKAMYPEGTEGLNPAAKGTFAALEVDGLKLYLPVRVVVG